MLSLSGWSVYSCVLPTWRSTLATDQFSQPLHCRSSQVLRLLWDDNQLRDDILHMVPLTFSYVSWLRFVGLISWVSVKNRFSCVSQKTQEINTSWNKGFDFFFLGKKSPETCNSRLTWQFLGHKVHRLHLLGLLRVARWPPQLSSKLPRQQEGRRGKGKRACFLA